MTRDEALAICRAERVSVEHPEDLAAVVRALQSVEQRTIERCAAVCDEQVASGCLVPLEVYRAQYIADAIRALGGE